MQKSNINELKFVETKCNYSNKNYVCNPFRYLKPITLVTILNEYGKELPEETRAMIKEALKDLMPETWEILLDESEL